jgi:hypothetical protein
VRTRLSPARNRSGIDQLRHADNSAQASCARSSMPDEALMPTRSGGKFFVSPADARHHRPTDQRCAVRSWLSMLAVNLWTAGARISPIVHSDNGVLKCLTRDGYDMRGIQAMAAADASWLRRLPGTPGICPNPIVTLLPSNRWHLRGCSRNRN